MASVKFPKFVPEVQTLTNFLELMKVAFDAADITEDTKKVKILLTQLPTKYFDALRSLCALNSPSTLSLDDLESNLITLFNPPDTLVMSLAEFQDRVKQKSESYSLYFKDLNRLAELCRFKNKGEFLKYKLFLAARSEIFFATKFAEFRFLLNLLLHIYFS